MSKLETVLYSTEVSAAGDGRDGKVKSIDGLLDVELSRPVEMGGDGKNTNPEQLFGAGYAACFLSALQLIASNEEIPFPADTTVVAAVTLGTTIDSYGLAVQLKINLPHMERSAAEDLIQKAHVICPYSNAIRNNVVVNLSAV